MTYDRASDDPDINDVLYIGYFGSGAWATTAGGGAYNFYFTHNPGPALRSQHDQLLDNVRASRRPTPAYIPFNPPISRQLYAYRAWGFYAGVNGSGHDRRAGPGAQLASGHLANIQALLAPETPYGPEIKNAAVFTPLAGSMLTANQYFGGGSTPISAVVPEELRHAGHRRQPDVGLVGEHVSAGPAAEHVQRRDRARGRSRRPPTMSSARSARCATSRSAATRTTSRPTSSAWATPWPIRARSRR